MTGDYTLESADTIPTVDAGFLVLGKIGDLAWDDLNGNGIQDAGEPGVENVAATLTGTDNLGNDINISLNTDAAGMYMFGDLWPGTYKVTFAPPASSTYQPTALDDPSGFGDDTVDSDADPANNLMTPSYAITSGDTIPTLDAGFYVPGKLGDLVWEDINGNGIQNGGEPGIAGAQAVLTGTDGLGHPVGPLPMTTDDVGMYMFGDLWPGRYEVAFLPPGSAAFVPTAVDDPSSFGNDMTDSDADPDNGLRTSLYEIQSGDTIPTVDAGFLVPGKLGDLVWHDINGNGIQGADEPAIENVLVSLSGTDGLGNAVTLAPQTTDGAGMYMFGDLWPGSYKVTFTQPDGYDTATAVDDPAGYGDDAVDSDADPDNGLMTGLYLIESRDTIPTIDAGFLNYGKVGDIVWIDLDENGRQDTGEPVLEHAKLTLTGTDNLGNTFMEMQFTDENGNYMFTELWPGNYQMTFDLSSITAPAELVEFSEYLVFTMQDQGDDGGDNDANPNDFDSPIGMTDPFDLVSGTVNITIDAGSIIPCVPPTDLEAQNVMLTTFTLQWEVNNDPLMGTDVNNHCWNIEVGGVGFAPGDGQAVVMLTVCEGDPGVTVNGDQVSYDIVGLQPGACYRAHVSETCDGYAPPLNVVGWSEGVEFCTFDEPPVVTGSGAAPTCPQVSPGFAPDGALTVAVTDGASCSGTTYDVEVIDGPFALTPPAYSGVPAGDYTFTGAGPGTYTARVTETGPCLQKPALHPVEIQIVVPDAVDTEAPQKEVVDVLGNPVTALGPFVLPEGSCSHQMDLYVRGFDSCDGLITGSGAVTAIATTSPTTVDPGTQVTVTEDGTGFYRVSVNFSIGTTELTIAISDISGNETSMTYTVEVIDNTNPSLTMVGPNNVTIPDCAEDRPVIVTVYVDDLCDQSVDPDMLTVDFGGNPYVLNFDGGDYFEYIVTVGPEDDGQVWSATYVDASGNVGFADVEVGVEQAAGDQPPVILAADENVVMPVCDFEDTYYSFQILDDCEDINIDDIVFDDGGSGLTISFIDPDEDNNTVFVETTGAVAPGTYVLNISYQGTDLQPLLTVSEQADQSPVVTLPGNLNFTIPTCGESVTTTFSVTIHDDCDETLEEGNAFFTFCGEPIEPALVNNSNAGQLYAEFVLPITAADDGCLLIAGYTDSAGNTTTVDGLVSVTAQPDNWAPVVIYPSEDIQEELDPCGPSETEVCFEVTATDNCDGEIAAVVTIDGVEYPATDGNTYCVTLTDGDHQVLITAEDAAGNVTQEDFVVAIDQDPVPETNLACNDNLNLTLNGDCEATLIADLVLDGDFGCLTEADFEIVVVDSDVSNGPIVDGPGTYNFEITLAEGVSGNFTTCWGTVTAEDKTAPTIDCPADTEVATVTEDVQMISGELTAGDPQLETANYSCLLDAFNPPAGLHYYDTYTFTVTQSDVFTFDLLTGWNDGAMALFQSGFNPADPCQNVIGFSDDAFAAGQAPFDPLLRLALPLQAGQTYTLLVTSWPPDQTGDYEVAVISDGAGLLTGYEVVSQTFERELICDDFDQIFNQPNSMAFVGEPTVADNCTDPPAISFTDTFSAGGDCGEVVITRTFITEDEAGLTAGCTQEITLRKPTLADVTLPPFTAYLECDESFPTDGNGNPSPTVTGYPFLQTAFGVEDLDQTYCNLAASYADQERIEVCEGTYKLVREWTVLDWCAPGASFIYTQIIKVGDFTGPAISCPTVDYDWDGQPDPLVIPTGPFDCSAAFEAPLPTVTDNCSSFSILTEVITDVQVDVTNQYGQVVGQETKTIVVATIAPGQPRFLSGIPKGQHRFRYTVQDDCGNESVAECPFTVADNIEPTAICDDDLNISVANQGLARVYAADIDEGSWDNCGAVRLEVRRLVKVDADCNPVTPFYTPWGEFVEFNCCDAGQTATIELRVWDDANHNGVFGGWYGDGPDAADQSNLCWLEVMVEDKIDPVCVAPHAASIDCDALPADFDPQDTIQLQLLFGTASAQDNCLSKPEELTPVVNLDDCGFGTIVRRFRATDNYGNVSTNSCQQLVTVNEVHDYEIKFPRDAEANCGAPVVDTIETHEIGCDLLAVSVEDEFFSASGDECYKIFRTYRVINWCEYDGESEPVVISRDEDCDGNPGDENIWVLVRPNGVTYLDRDNNENNTNPFAFTKGASCDGLTNPTGHWINSTFDGDANRDPVTGQMDAANPGEGDPGDKVRDIASRGYWQYTQHIRVYDDSDPEIAIGDFDNFCSLDNESCDGPVSIPFSVTENCTPDDVAIKAVLLDAFYDGQNFASDFSLADGLFEVTGEYPDYQISSTGLPIGSHAFEIQVEDGCGNTNALLAPFAIEDCKAPAPICINGLAIELMPAEPGVDADGDGDVDAGAMAIWASDFIAGPVADCSGPIVYSINLSGETPDIDQDGLVLTCDDLGTVIVEIHAWDAVGNHDFCETYVLVQDNLNELCSDNTATIAGGVYTEEAVPVEQVEVALSGQSANDMITGTDGLFAFGSLAAGYDYSVTPYRNDDHVNGVTTFDLVKITKHILGEELLGSPYKIIAADANRSNSVSTLDLIQLRKLILGITDELPDNTSWRFVDAAYSFPDVDDPFAEAFPEVLNFNDLEEELLEEDFVGVKIGDVNGSAQPNALVTDERNLTGQLTVSVRDEQLQAGETYTVAFTADDLHRIQGYQFTLQFDRQKVALIDVLDGVASPENFGLRFVEEGLLTTSWHLMENAAPASGATDILFRLVLRAEAAAALSDVLFISSRVTVAEAYDEANQTLAIALDFGRETPGEAGFRLYQNVPNPFRGTTAIGFEMPQPAPVVLKVRDITGRIIKLLRIEAVKGYNELILEQKDLFPGGAGGGVLQYSLETGGFQATRQMVISR